MTTVSGAVTDRAGNSADDLDRVRIDTIAPGIIGAQTPAANGAGWNNTDVTVSFNCTDTALGYRDGRLHRAGHARRGRAPVGDGYRDRLGRQHVVDDGQRDQRRRDRADLDRHADDGAERERLVQRAGHDSLDVLRRALGHRGLVPAPTR